MNGLIRIDRMDLFTPPNTLQTRGHLQRVYKKPAAKRARRNSFSQRVVDDWNNLPVDVIDAPSLHTFKDRLDNWWKEYHYIAE